VSDEQSWGADTVAFGRACEADAPSTTPRRRPPRGPRRGLPRPGSRTIGLAAVAIGLLMVVIVALGSGSGSPAAPVREVADPAPRVVVKARSTHRRLGTRSEHRKPAITRQPKGHLEEGKREPEKASAQPHERSAPEPEPVPIAKAEPEPMPVAEGALEPTPQPVPTTPAPTSPATEFGL
jgi:hypothetical protein